MVLTTEEKREIAEDFLEYLEARDLIKTWFRPHLQTHYHAFKQERMDDGLPTTAFSTVLFALSHYGTKELQVRGGVTVVFRNTPDWHDHSVIYNEQLSGNTFVRNRKRIPQAVLRDWKLQVDGVSIAPLGLNVKEHPPGHYTLSSMEGSNEPALMELEVKNKSQFRVYLENCKLITKHADFKLECNRTMISPGHAEIVKVQSLHEVEVSTTELEFTFIVQQEYVFVLRYLRFVTADESEVTEDPEEDDKELRKKRLTFRDPVYGVKPDVLYQNKLKMAPPPQNKPPKDLIEAIRSGAFKSGNTPTGRKQKRFVELLKNATSQENYAEKFHLLLHIEELQNQQDIKRYDMHDASLLKRDRSKLVYLNVPGLAEKRPSVLRGDSVYAIRLSKDGKQDGPAYQGYVHHVEKEEVGLGFSQDMVNGHINNMRYYVRFSFNRLSLKLMHRAVDRVMTRSDGKDLLFPTHPPMRYVPSSDSLFVLYNPDLDHNEQQSHAVYNIVFGNTSPIYIIYGPPGTGKTVTMVEAIQQTLRHSPTCHMLVCAPSNSACDLLASRLLEHVDKREILRMHAASRFWREVPDDVKAVSNYDGEYVYRAKEELMKYRIIITTLITAGRIASAQFPAGHFTRVFIDEAGQAMEPECIIAISNVLSTSGGKVILAGDPKQLGPVIHSSLAKTNGLQISLLERLMDTCHIYRKNQETGLYDLQCVTKLLNNYRSHEAILKVSNVEFYDGELRVCAKGPIRKYLCEWEVLPRRGFPIIFHGVQGEDRQERTSPSFFNSQEVKIVMRYVAQLLDIRDRGRQIKEKDIGIVTPYRKQVEKIRKELKKPDIKVGSVEEFQGQERKVIIISTVRSNTKHLQFDKTFHLGFLRNPKRFNVAVTRAKSLLIVVGNSKILCRDKYWQLLLDYCIENGAYTGIRFNSDDAQAEAYEFESLFSRMTISQTTDDGTTDDQANPQWRQDP